MHNFLTQECKSKEKRLSRGLYFSWLSQFFSKSNLHILNEFQVITEVNVHSKGVILFERKTTFVLRSTED